MKSIQVRILIFRISHLLSLQCVLPPLWIQKINILRQVPPLFRNLPQIRPHKPRVLPDELPPPPPYIPVTEAADEEDMASDCSASPPSLSGLPDSKPM